MGIDGDHRLDPVAGDNGEIGIIDAGRPKVGDVGMAELVRGRIESGSKASGFPHVTVEIALPPKATRGVGKINSLAWLSSWASIRAQSWVAAEPCAHGSSDRWTRSALLRGLKNGNAGDPVKVCAIEREELAEPKPRKAGVSSSAS